MTAIVLFSGFREGERTPSGSRAMNVMLREQFSGRARIFDVRPWSHDTDGFAKMLEDDGYDRVVALGYSYGGGYALPNFCRSALRRGIRVPLVLLCDAVWRPLWFPRRGWANVFCLRSLIPDWPKIRIPDQVERIAAIRQIESLPSGHRIAWDGITHVPKIVPGVDHRSIDESHAWVTLVFREIEPLIS